MQEISRDKEFITYKDGNCTIKFVISHLSQRTPEEEKQAVDKMLKEVSEVYLRNAEHIIKKVNERSQSANNMYRQG